MNTPSRCLSATLLLVTFAACGKSGNSPTAVADTTPPTVTLSASSTSVTSAGSITLVATATDNVAVTVVTFAKDGMTVGTDATPPYELTVPLAATDNGTRSFTATARDAADNQATSAPVNVTVAIPSLRRSDDFNDNRIDATDWVVSTAGGATAAEVNGRIELTIPAAITESMPIALITLRCAVAGDFDFQVEYQLLDWPARSGVRSALNSTIGAAERVSFAVNDFTGEESYVSHHFDGGITTEVTTDTSGALRLTRVGQTFTSYYRQGSQWRVMQATSGASAEQVFPILQAWTHDNIFIGQRTRVAFDNFVINTGQAGACS